MTALGAEIAALIAAEGPIALDRYMALCLGHPRHGYYMTRDPLGAHGDFVTAPEISQVFGELIGAWAAATWDAMGRPPRLRLIECGPGRGTLMQDLIRAARAAPDFRAAIDLHLVETSPVLAARQREAMAAAGTEATWHADLATVPPGATLVIGNEFLDALPIRQFVMTPKGWRERVVGLADAKLTLGLAPDPVPPALVPAALRQAPPGAVVEICPALDGLAATLGTRREAGPVAALFIDYGHARSAHGETLQAVRAHGFTDPLAEPGEADLTAHVDFAALGRAAAGHGLAASAVISQRELLFRLGLQARAEALASANPRDIDSLKAAVERLIDPAPAGMGALFKALVIHSPGLAVPAFDS
ncbi:class I SAM-dependent methyltransferase [Phreatobacter stygius]|uniref:Class I SAM-dependent methyltransferase n=1 Tax=Phreatobacter stygius TaxID=1940610 RepID=A0A4D7B129_9HYPH|nr:SAM-dependent methyltransferase [Phreatobacter stygius]QCI63740.1 class I SAM-dependent methyltransferase [Phreatobacter stygius]